MMNDDDDHDDGDDDDDDDDDDEINVHNMSIIPYGWDNYLEHIFPKYPTPYLEH
jgi:hypothetical protein